MSNYCETNNIIIYYAGVLLFGNDIDQYCDTNVAADIDIEVMTGNEWYLLWQYSVIVCYCVKLIPIVVVFYNEVVAEGYCVYYY